MRVVQNRPAVDAHIGRRQVALQTLDRAPLKIQPRLARLDDVHLLARAEAHVADENPPARRINRHAMRTPQAEAEKFFEHVRLADEGIVIRDVIIRRDTGGRLLGDRMADGAAALVHVNPKHAGKKIAGDDLRGRIVIVIAVRPVKKPVGRMKKHPAAIVPHLVAGLVHQRQLRTRDGHAVRVQREPREPVVIGTGDIQGRPGVHVARHGSGNHPDVIDEHEMIRREARMKRQPQQSGIIPALALVADVQHQFFLRHVRAVGERPHAAFAFPDAQLRRPEHMRQADGVGEI